MNQRRPSTATSPTGCTRTPTTGCRSTSMPFCGGVGRSGSARHGRARKGGFPMDLTTRVQTRSARPESAGPSSSSLPAGRPAGCRAHHRRHPPARAAAVRARAERRDRRQP
jgi:hypothetical protein